MPNDDKKPSWFWEWLVDSFNPFIEKERVSNDKKYASKDIELGMKIAFASAIGFIVQRIISYFIK